MICWIPQNQSTHKYNFSLIYCYLNSLLNNSDKFNIFWKSLNIDFWSFYDFFQNFSLFFLNSMFNFLSIELFNFFLRFFFEFIWFFENNPFLIEALSLSFCFFFLAQGSKIHVSWYGWFMAGNNSRWTQRPSASDSQWIRCFDLSSTLFDPTIPSEDPSYRL